MKTDKELISNNKNRIDRALNSYPKSYVCMFKIIKDNEAYCNLKKGDILINPITIVPYKSSVIIHLFTAFKGVSVYTLAHDEYEAIFK